MVSEKMKKFFYLLCVIYSVLSIVLVPKLGGKIVPADCLFIPLFIVFGWIIVQEKHWKVAREFLVVFFLVILFMLIDLAVTGTYFQGLVRIIGQGYLFMVFLVFYYFSESRMKFEGIFKAWLGIALVIALIGLAGMALHYSGFHFVDERIVTGPGDQLPKNLVRIAVGVAWMEQLAIFWLGAILISFYFRARRYGKFASSYWFGGILIILVSADFMTFTRSFFCWIVAWLVWQSLLDQKRDWLRTGLRVAGMIMVIGTLFILTIWNIFPIHFNHDAQKKELGVTVSTKYSSPRRLFIYPEAVKSIRGNLIWGNGPGHNATGPLHIGSLYYPEGGDGHNIILQLWATRGIFGLIFYLAFWLMVIIEPWRKFRGRPMPLEMKAVLAIALGTILAGFAVDIEDLRSLYIILGLLAGFSSSQYPLDQA